MISNRLKRFASALLLAGSLVACAPAFAAQDAPTPSTAVPTVVAPSAPAQPPVTAIPAPAPAPDPATCITGEPFHRLTPDLFVCVDTRYHPLVPMSIADMVHALGLPDIFITKIIPRESGWLPGAHNKYGCLGLTQHCGKVALYNSYGFVFRTDALNPWVHLEMTKVLYDQLGLQPWDCSRCSLHHGR